VGGELMSKMVQILKSDDLESRQRRIQQLKNEIDNLNVALEINLDAFEKLRNRTA
jgi:hypothetical protein